jgi:cytochrome c oxidase subunit 3/cytochrome o ubiquinol oxidase subunit 3
LTGPAPRDVLEVPVFFTICLLSSSITVHFADRALKRDHRGAFVSLWFLTFFLGATFLFGTAQEWHRLIYERGFTISTNLFGTTYYSLVGLHAFHVTAGLLIFLVVLVFALAGRVDRSQLSRIGVIAMYWHFVDSVWIVVFTVVYVLGR